MIRFLITATVLAVSTCTADAGFLHFDDVGPTDAALNSYGGFNWDASFKVVSDSVFDQYHNSFSAPTASYAVHNSGVTELAATSGTFNFDGAYFASWTLNDLYADYSSRTVTLEGWKDGAMVATQSMAIGAGYDWFAASSDFNGIDTLKFKSDGVGLYYLFDNFTYSMSAVPEPASLAMWGLGALGACVFARRRRRQA